MHKFEIKSNELHRKEKDKNIFCKFYFAPTFIYNSFITLQKIDIFDPIFPMEFIPSEIMYFPTDIFEGLYSIKKF